MISGNATGFNNEPFQQSYPVYRESNTANVSLEFAQENEMRGAYPSPVGTPVALSYNGGVDLQHWQTSSMQFSQVPTLPAQGACKGVVHLADTSYKDRIVSNPLAVSISAIFAKSFYRFPGCAGLQ